MSNFYQGVCLPTLRLDGNFGIDHTTKYYFVVEVL